MWRSAQAFGRPQDIVPPQQSGRVVPAFERSAVREIVERPYRIIYRLVRRDEVHVLTVHHGAKRLPHIGPD